MEQFHVDEKTGGCKTIKLQRFDLVPPEPMKALAEHFGKNCKDHGGKYDANNWRKGYKWSMSVAALERHLNEWKTGQDYDIDPAVVAAGNPQTHLLICVAWHAIVLYTFHVLGLGTDDRPSTSTEHFTDSEVEK